MPLFSPHNVPHTRPPEPPVLGRRGSRPLDAASPAPQAPEAGAAATALLKRYRPLETRGGGTFGTVEICLDTRLQRRVAIKRMPLAGTDAAADGAPAETHATALAEARTASMLSDAHIVSVIDFTYDQGYAYLVMEYVDGMSLEEFLAGVDGHSLTYDEAAAVTDALIQALAHAHENGVLHLDVKPANVLIDRSGNVKLADFGMATLSRAAGFGDARGGTIGYMPPEQLIGAAVDERADIFALAAVLYEALCAEAPFRAETPAASIELIREGATDPIEYLPDLPELAADALLAALSSAPEDRPASVEEFGERFLAGLGNARAGKRSLAHIIAELTSDDEETADALAEGEARPEIPLDPEKGWLGSRTPRARALVAGGIAGFSVAIASVQVLAMLGFANPLAGLIIAFATGGAAFVAPQLGSALIATGFIVAIAQQTEAFPLLPVAVVLIALTVSWWYVWGRASAGASAAFVALIAAGALTGNPCLLAGPIAVFAGYLADPVCAATTTAIGAIVSVLFTAAIATGGVLGAGEALAAFADFHVIAGIALATATAAAVSALCGIFWDRYQGGGGKGALAGAYACAGFMVVLQLCLANPVENASSQTLPFAVALAVGALSSIILFICMYLLGYRKESAEGDRP